MSGSPERWGSREKGARPAGTRDLTRSGAGTQYGHRVPFGRDGAWPRAPQPLVATPALSGVPLGDLLFQLCLPVTSTWLWQITSSLGLGLPCEGGWAGAL